MRILERVYKVMPYPINRKKVFVQQWDILWYHLISHAFRQVDCKFVATLVIYKPRLNCSSRFFRQNTLQILSLILIIFVNRQYPGTTESH